MFCPGIPEDPVVVRRLQIADELAVARDGFHGVVKIGFDRLMCSARALIFPMQSYSERLSSRAHSIVVQDFFKVFCDGRKKLRGP
jgi:hypothetical protein